jgi:hypothetical protein
MAKLNEPDSIRAFPQCLHDPVDSIAGQSEDDFDTQS